MKACALFLIILFLVGCSGVTTTRYTLAPAPNECQVTEVRSSTLSTLSAAVCWDGDTRPIGLTGGAGKAAISVPLELLGAAASAAGPIVGATILGGALIKASHATMSVLPVPIVPGAP